jgi:hypothetical protein
MAPSPTGDPDPGTSLAHNACKLHAAWSDSARCGALRLFALPIPRHSNHRQRCVGRVTTRLARGAAEP